LEGTGPAGATAHEGSLSPDGCGWRAATPAARRLRGLPWDRGRSEPESSYRS
jgi:hypothetical protein